MQAERVIIPSEIYESTTSQSQTFLFQVVSSSRSTDKTNCLLNYKCPNLSKLRRIPFGSIVLEHLANEIVTCLRPTRNVNAGVPPIDEIVGEPSSSPRTSTTRRSWQCSCQCLTFDMGPSRGNLRLTTIPDHARDPSGLDQIVDCWDSRVHGLRRKIDATSNGTTLLRDSCA